MRFMRLFLSERTIGGPVLGCKFIFELPYPPPPSILQNIWNQQLADVDQAKIPRKIFITKIL